MPLLLLGAVRLSSPAHTLHFGPLIRWALGVNRKASMMFSRRRSYGRSRSYGRARTSTAGRASRGYSAYRRRSPSYGARYRRAYSRMTYSGRRY
ncbi:MAG: hypothetical protein [Microviridae sp.]|nr:MAG: hypothetical protein [Microviridae sp.]